MIGSGGLAKRRQMATHTFSGESKTIELTDCPHLVARVAVDGGMSTDQGKTILMFVDVVNGNLPAICVVAEFALSAVFAAVQIGVAILAL